MTNGNTGGRPDYWWETPIEREERLAKARRNRDPQFRFPDVPWWRQAEYWAMVLVIGVLVFWAFVELSDAPVDPCGVRCEDARP